MRAGFKRDDPFKLRKSIAPMARPDENREDDVAKLETMLGHSGDLDLRETGGPTGYYGVRQMEAAQRFQKRNGLEPDGIVRPNGPTFRKLSQQLDSSSTSRQLREPGIGGRQFMVAKSADGRRYAANRKEKEQETKPEKGVEWNAFAEKEHGHRNTATASLSTYRTDGPMRIELEQYTLGLDGLDGSFTWWPLDERGNRQQLLTGPDGPTESLQLGKWSLIPNVVEWSKPKVVAPPYDNPHGWELEIAIPHAQRTYNGNSGYKGIKVYGSRNSSKANE